MGEEYFLATSTFTWLPGVPIYRSPDLEQWTQIGNVLDRPSQIDLDDTDAWASFGVFAPTLRHHRGRLWLITTCVGLSGSHNFMVTADDPAGPWSDPVPIAVEGIDPDLAWDDDGNCWLHYSATGSGIKRCRIDDATGALLEEPVDTWSGTGLQHPEGPHLYQIDEWWYLMIAEGGTGSGHAVSIARGPSPTGPWTSCPFNPILSHRSTDHPIQNTGHADLVEGRSGRWSMTLLGVRPRGMPASFHVLGRETFITGVEWEDGWPVVATPTLGPDRDPEEFVDDFEGRELDAGWISRRIFPSDIADLGTRPGCLVLRDVDTTLRSARPAFIGRRQRHHRCRVDTVVEVDSGEAGLAVVYDETSHFRVGVDGDGLFVSACSGPFDEEIARAARPGHRVKLWVQTVEGLGGPDQVVLGYEDEGGESVQLASLDGRYLSTEVVGGFLGRVIGVYCSVGEASFDYFRYIGE